MLYDFDIRKLVRRYFPTWFRWEENVSFGYALCSYLGIIHDKLMDERQAALDQYKFNGLKHSLEWLLNDAYDPLNRRIYITVDEQQPVMYCQNEDEAAIDHCSNEEELSPHWCLNENEGINYLHEFVINIPSNITFNAVTIFEMVDLYRYAGRRPAIRTYGTFNVTINYVLYPNGLVVWGGYIFDGSIA